MRSSYNCTKVEEVQLGKTMKMRLFLYWKSVTCTNSVSHRLYWHCLFVHLQQLILSVSLVLHFIVWPQGLVATLHTQLTLQPGSCRGYLQKKIAFTASYDNGAQKNGGRRKTHITATNYFWTRSSVGGGENEQMTYRMEINFQPCN